MKEYSSQLWSSSSDPISIEGDRIALQWPCNTGWNVTPDREPCEVWVYTVHPRLPTVKPLLVDTPNSGQTPTL